MRIEGEEKNLNLKQLKMAIYSCHDRNIFLILLNILSENGIKELNYDFFVPPFASSLILEVLHIGEKSPENTWNIDQLYVQLKLND